LHRYDGCLVDKYKELYAEKNTIADRFKETHKLVQEYCEKFGLKNYIPRPIEHYPENLRLNKSIAEEFYLKAREISVSGGYGYREWAYRKAAWSLDELASSIEEIFHEEGLEGLKKIKEIGNSLSKQIIEHLNQFEI
jgi:hypothetical protein